MGIHLRSHLAGSHNFQFLHTYCVVLLVFETPQFLYARLSQHATSNSFTSLNLWLHFAKNLVVYSKVLGFTSCVADNTCSCEEVYCCSVFSEAGSASLLVTREGSNLNVPASHYSHIQFLERLNITSASNVSWLSPLQCCLPVWAYLIQFSIDVIDHTFLTRISQESPRRIISILFTVLEDTAACTSHSVGVMFWFGNYTKKRGGGNSSCLRTFFILPFTDFQLNQPLSAPICRSTCYRCVRILIISLKFTLP